jgi:4-hydroxy-3-polyprenylbenzoate decarboxylase
MGCVFTHSPTSGKRNCGMYRLQVFDERTLGFHSQIHKHGRAAPERSGGKGRRIDVASRSVPDPA